MSGAGSTAECEEAVSFSDRLTVIRELMGSLDVVTRSGQDLVMQKLVQILREEVLREGLPLFGPDLGTAMDALTELEHEAGRAAPMPNLFNNTARVVVDMLTQAWATGRQPIGASFLARP